MPEMKQLRKDGISKRAIAKQLGVSRASGQSGCYVPRSAPIAPGTGFLYAAPLLVGNSLGEPFRTLQ